MKSNVWILNHYATDSFYNKGGRHYWFAENLKTKGYQPVIFCANTRHNIEDIVDVRHGNYTTDEADGIPFVFVKTSAYEGNGISRIKNMIAFYRKLFPTVKAYAKQHGKPDIILASSVHPLTLAAGIKIAKKFDVPCICEVRDLWPESMVAYGILQKNSMITKLLYKGEKWLYKRADSIVMTWEGGKDYIIEHGWSRDVNSDKVVHISNGVIVDAFDHNSDVYWQEDDDLDDPSFKNIVYTGSIRKVNNLGLLLDSAKLIQNKGMDDIRFLIYGTGTEKEMLENRCKEENINNVIFKGWVDKSYIPSILKRSYANILHNSSTSLDKYGQSQNKLFEYLAAGKCIIQTYTTGYSICDRYACGISADKQTPKEIADAVISASSNESKNQEMGKRAREAAYDFDFTRLTNKLIGVIEQV